jgi:hypothetical protein
MLHGMVRKPLALGGARGQHLQILVTLQTSNVAAAVKGTH